MALSGSSRLAQKSSSEIIAHVDGNSFYCSCERAFQPKLRGVPVGVLSNNDGCLIALTPELKALGVPMGTPLFKVQNLIERHKVALFSSNYELYGDMSARMMEVFRYFSPFVEVYSIDEAFLSFSHVPVDQLVQEGHRIRNTVYHWTGLPVGVGIAETKTLAKLANKLSKKQGGVVSLYKRDDIDGILKAVPVTDVWGVNYRMAERLLARQIKTVLDLKRADDARIMKHFPVTVMRTVC